jgi:predicted DNA-binding transcriptional regulator AlpA
VTEATICERLEISRITLWRWVRAGNFPAPIYPGPNTKRWTEQMYDAYVRQLVEQRDNRPSV